VWTAGYGDITPTNDAEIAYVLVALVVGALVFGYMISNLSAIVNSLDRQAANVEEKMDAVKQYSQWRDLPHPLAVRLKRHYKYYYKRTAPFDEFELLNECPPALRHDVTRAVLQETLGKVPIFKDRLMVDPEFQNDIFPVAKPVHFHAGEIIFHRGERSRELFFMLRGEIDVYNETTHTVERKLTPTQEIFMTDSIYRAAHDPSLETRRRVSKAIITQLDVLKPKSESYFLPARASEDGQKSDPPSIEPLAILHTGCFGESVLTGRRRPNKLVAFTNVEALVVSKDDLLRVFEQNPRAARRVFAAVIKETERKERLHALSLTFMLAAAERGSELWGALRFQLGWARFQRSSRAFDLFGPMDSGGGLDLSTRFEVHDPLTHTEADLRSMSTSDHSPDDPMSFISTGKNANGQTHISLRTAGHVVDSLFDVHNKVRHAEEESVEQLREDRDAARRERDELRQELQMLREHLSKVI
jgi:CRP-like cAMP-binding protein